MKKILKTTYPCLIKTDSDACELEENDTLEIEDEQFLFVYPQNGNIPFYIDVNSETENKFVSIIKHDSKTIFLLERTAGIRLKRKEQLNFAGKICDITIGDKSISFESASQKVEYSCLHDCKDYQIFKYKSYACVQFEKDFYAFNIQKSKLFHFSGEILTFESGKLSATKKFHDSMRREKTLTYFFDENISLEDEAFVSESQSEDAELLPYKVMESAKAKDYAFVISNLSENLKTQINADQIKEFFGTIKCILPLSTDEFISITSTGKNYIKFSVLGNKIEDISIDNL